LEVIVLTMIGPEARKIDHVARHEGAFAEGLGIEKGENEHAEQRGSDEGEYRDVTIDHGDTKMADQEVNEDGPSKS
jgi:hypothetical protein